MGAASEGSGIHSNLHFTEQLTAIYGKIETPVGQLMAVPGRQLELLPFHVQTVAQRKAFIRARLEGLEHRQAARDARREERNQRRRARRDGRLPKPAEQQLTIDDLIERSHSTDLDKPVSTLPLFPDIFDE